MPSVSLRTWNAKRGAALDELEAAHRSLGGAKRGRRYTTQQINQAYAMLLSAQFQGFCRDLHSESADHFVQSVPAGLQTVLRAVLVQSRKIDQGNQNPGNLGNDYNRFGILFWDEVKARDSRNQARLNQLDDLNKWRNAIAHQDFRAIMPAPVVLPLKRVRSWRKACNEIAISFDEVMCSHLQAVNGTAPW